MEEADGLVDGISDVQEAEIDRGNHAGFRHFINHGYLFFPVIGPHEDDREVIEFIRLDKSQGFEQFVECAEAAGHDDEGVAIFDQHHFAHEEVAQGDMGIQVWIGVLFVRQFDIAGDGAAADIFGAAITGLHDAGASAGHDGESHFCGGRSHLTGQLVMRIIFLGAGGPKNGDAWADEMQSTEAAEHVPSDAHQGDGFFGARLGAGEEEPVFDWGEKQAGWVVGGQLDHERMGWMGCFLVMPL